MKKKILLIAGLCFLFIAGGFAIWKFVFKTKIVIPESGKAAFYEFDATITDSILQISEDDKLLSMLVLVRHDEFDTNEKPVHELEKSGGVFSFSAFDKKLNNVIINYRSDMQYFLRAANYKALQNIQGDSLYLPSTDLINVITDDILINNHFNFLNSIVGFYKLNAFIPEYSLPEIYDSIYWSSITKRLDFQFQVLHGGNKLSLINYPKIVDGADSTFIKSIPNFLLSLIDAGLCGIIVSEKSQLAVLETIGFDGLIIFDLAELGMLTDDVINGADLFLTDFENLESTKNKISEIIKRRELKNKAVKPLRAHLWTMQKNDSVVTEFKAQDKKLAKSRFVENSITVVLNNEKLIPFINADQSFHIVNASGFNIDIFTDAFAQYSDYTKSEYKRETPRNINTPNGTDVLVIISNSDSSDYSEPVKKAVEKAKQTVIVEFGKISSQKLSINADVYLKAYDTDDFNLSYTAQILWGGVATSGVLAENVNDSIGFGHGINTERTRLKYSFPEDAGLNSDMLEVIDSIVKDAIAMSAMPGCQVFVAKNGIVVYNKSFGHHDYSRSRAVKQTDLYDIASITKIAATTLAVMKMFDERKIDLNEKIGEYFDDTEIDYGNIPADTFKYVDTISIAGKTPLQIRELFAGKDTIHINDTLVESTEIVFSRVTPRYNIFQVPIRSLLVHQSGISPSLPILPYLFYRKTYADWLESGKLDPILFEEPEIISNILYNDSILSDTLVEIAKKPEIKVSEEESFNFFFSRKRIKDSADIAITDKMYLRNNFRDSLYNDVKRLRVYSRNFYEYSCMNMILMQMIVDSINDESIDSFLKSKFYKSLGMNNTTYNPLNHYNKTRIVPTEEDRLWRKQLIHGTVHDPSAAILGGLSGNAGLFSTATDLGILSQMWLNGGTYGGKRYLNRSTIMTFVNKQSENHRGLGFDKPTKRGVHAEDAPASSYGHLGFTGCCLWVDPDNEIVFIFLSNRVHPRSSNYKLISHRIRQKIHQVIYDAMVEE
jgi:CubicO group peptidase (beta-lactamase class C family)